MEISISDYLLGSIHAVLQPERQKWLRENKYCPLFYCLLNFDNLATVCDVLHIQQDIGKLYNQLPLLLRGYFL